MVAFIIVAIKYTFVILLVAFITCIVAIKKKKLGVALVVYFMLNNHSDHVYFVAFGLSLLLHKIFNLIFANYYNFVVFFGLIYDNV